MCKVDEITCRPVGIGAKHRCKVCLFTWCVWCVSAGHHYDQNSRAPKSEERPVTMSMAREDPMVTW